MENTELTQSDIERVKKHASQELDEIDYKASSSENKGQKMFKMFFDKIFNELGNFQNVTVPSIPDETKRRFIVDDIAYTFSTHGRGTDSSDFPTVRKIEVVSLKNGKVIDGDDIVNGRKKSTNFREYSIAHDIAILRTYTDAPQYFDENLAAVAISDLENNYDKWKAQQKPSPITEKSSTFRKALEKAKASVTRTKQLLKSN